MKRRTPDDNEEGPQAGRLTMIAIPSEAHARFKAACAIHGLKIGARATQALNEATAKLLAREPRRKAAA